MDPVREEPVIPPSEARLSRPASLSIATFRAVAEEVAARLQVPIAICERDRNEPGSAMLPFRSMPLGEAQKKGATIVEIVEPPSQSASPLAAAQQIIKEALPQIPGGEEVDKYFGITSRAPKQAGASGDEVLATLRRLDVAAQKGGTVADVIKNLTRLADETPIDPDALRAFFRPTKPPSENAE